MLSSTRRRTHRSWMRVSNAQTLWQRQNYRPWSFVLEMRNILLLVMRGKSRMFFPISTRNLQRLFRMLKLLGLGLKGRWQRGIYRKYPTSFALKECSMSNNCYGRTSWRDTLTRVNGVPSSPVQLSWWEWKKTYADRSVWYSRFEGEAKTN